MTRTTNERVTYPNDSEWAFDVIIFAPAMAIGGIIRKQFNWEQTYTGLY